MRSQTAGATFCAALFSMAATAACNLVAPASADSGSFSDRESADGGGDSTGTDGAGDGDAGLALEGPGALVVVAREISLVTERRCDLDGDGVHDNSVADLGTPHSELFAIALNNVLAGTIDRVTRIVLHFPRVDDLAAPEASDALMLVYDGVEEDYPRNASSRRDDFDGDEGFYAGHRHLDGCGEPKFFFEGARIDAGELVVPPGRFPFVLEDEPIVLSETSLQGTIAPGGTSFDVVACGYLALGELGGHEGIASVEGSFLSELLAGGTILGYPELPGLSPDVDVDGDGLERIELDQDGHILRCIDGDETAIEGEDCWQEARIADGISLTLRMTGVSARFVGREPAWRYRVDRSCPGGEPERSLFDAGYLYHEGECVAGGERCDPLSLTPCCDESHRCSGANNADYHCLTSCSPNRCDYGEMVGLCRTDGYCVPATLRPQFNDCEPGTSGCTTEYLLSEGTRCLEAGESAFCLEQCQVPPSPTGCDRSDNDCMPLVDEEGGLCIVPPSPSDE